MRKLFLSALVLGFLVPQASAQLGKLLEKSFNIQAVCKNNNGLLGIEFGPGADPAKPGTLVKDYLWVSGRRATTSSPHQLYQIDIHASGGPKLVKAYNVPPAANASSWGLRDLAYDFTTNILYGGTDTSASKALFAFDCKNLKFDQTKFILTQTNLTCLRAIAINPIKKLFYVTSWTTNIEVIDFTGKVVAAYPSTKHGATSVYGLAYVEFGSQPGFLWSFGQGGSSGTSTKVPGSMVVLRQHDLAKGCVSTGVMTFSDPTIPYQGGLYAQGGIAGGIAYAMDKKYGKAVFWCLHQANPNDMAAVLDPVWLTGRGCPGSSKTEPLPGMSGDAPYLGNKNWQLQVSGISGASTAFLWMGRSTKTWKGIPLPFALDPFGMKSCSIFSSWDYLIGASAVTAGIGIVKLPLPGTPTLHGLGLYWQWLVYDPKMGGTGLPFVVSPSCGAALK